MSKKLYMSLIFSNLLGIKKINLKHRMEKLYSKIVKKI